MIQFWCRSCNLPSGQNVCEHCGKPIPPTSLADGWQSSRRPIQESANCLFVARVALYTVLAAFLFLLLAEAVLDPSLKRLADFLKKSGAIGLLLVVFLAILTGGLLLMMLQGPEIEQVMIEPKGILKRTWLYNPGRIACWARFLGYPAHDAEESERLRRVEGGFWLLAHEEYLTFQDTARLRLVSRRRLARLYRPRAFLFMLLHIPADEYEEAAAMLHGKLKKVEG